MERVRVGIQGGKGSFNEEALNLHATHGNLGEFDKHYLYTTEGVLAALDKEEIDFGLFAVRNSTAGDVAETKEVIPNHEFVVLNEFDMPIRHFLMAKETVGIEDLEVIVAHPQVLKQCRKNLEKRYPQLKLISGEGDLIDTAKAAEALQRGLLDEKNAILGPKVLSEIYALKVLHEDLQDDENNITTFVFVSKQ